MADISKITLLNGNEYNIKDTVARERISEIPSWALASTKPTYTASEVGAAEKSHTHTQLYSFNGDRDGEVKVSPNSVILSAADTNTFNTITMRATSTTIKKVVTPTEDGDAANKKYVDDAVAGLTVPTKVSDLTNDSGFITSAPVTSVNGQTGAVTLNIPSATTVTQTLTSGTKIGEVNGVALYAPSYTDADGVSY